MALSAKPLSVLDSERPHFCGRTHHMFEHDRSAARGEMSAHRIIAFKHASALGNASAHALFDRVMVGRVAGDEIRLPGDPRLDNLPPARCFADYRVEINRKNVPEGVEILDFI
jgi:CRISPR-associated protein Csd2